MVAARTGSDYIFPTGFPTQPARYHVVDGQVFRPAPTVLTGEIVPPEDFFACEFDDRPGPLDHSIQSDDRGKRESLGNSMNHAPSVHDECGFISHNHIDCPVGGRDIDRLEVSVQYKNRLIHLITIMIITVLIPLIRIMFKVGSELIA